MAKKTQQVQPEALQVVGSGKTAEGRTYRLIKRPKEDSSLWGHEIRQSGPHAVDRSGGLLMFAGTVVKDEDRAPREPQPHRFTQPVRAEAFA